MSRQRILLIAFLSLLLASCGSGEQATNTPLPTNTPAPTPTPTPTEEPIDTALIERGVEIYLAQYCGTCHQLDAANTRGTFGPAHNDAGLVAASRLEAPGYAGNANDAESYIRESILDPLVYYTEGFEITAHHMPTYSHLPEEDIDALVYLLLNQKTESEEEPTE